MTDYTPLLIKRSISKLKVGDVLIRTTTGERCKLLAIMQDTSMPPGISQQKRYRFWGFDVLAGGMCWMFDLSDDRVVPHGYTPHTGSSYTEINGRAEAE